MSDHDDEEFDYDRLAIEVAFYTPSIGEDENGDDQLDDPALPLAERWDLGKDWQDLTNLAGIEIHDFMVAMGIPFYPLSLLMSPGGWRAFFVLRNADHATIIKMTYPRIEFCLHTCRGGGDLDFVPYHP